MDDHLLLQQLEFDFQDKGSAQESIDSFHQVSSLDVNMPASAKSLISKNKISRGLARIIAPGEGLATIFFETKPNPKRNLKIRKVENSELLDISFHLEESEFDEIVDKSHKSWIFYKQTHH